MMAAAVQAVCDPQRSDRSGTRALATVDEVLPLLHRLAMRRFCGEVTLRGHGTLCVSLFEGAIVWVRSDGYPEHLGDVLRRECGLSVRTLQQVIVHCKTNKLRFGDGLVQMGLVGGAQLRDCLQRHLSAQLSEFLTWPGSLSSLLRPLPHRYDHTLTFSVDELLVGAQAPTASERKHLEALVRRCREQLCKLSVVAIAGAQTGEMLCRGPEDPMESHALLSLCSAGVRRLAENRITGACDGPTTDVAVVAGKDCVLVHRIAWYPSWLLMLGGPHGLGPLFAVAQSADISPRMVD